MFRSIVGVVSALVLLRDLPGRQSKFPDDLDRCYRCFYYPPPPHTHKYTFFSIFRTFIAFHLFDLQFIKLLALFKTSLSLNDYKRQSKLYSSYYYIARFEPFMPAQLSVIREITFNVVLLIRLSRMLELAASSLTFPLTTTLRD